MCVCVCVCVCGVCVCVLCVCVCVCVCWSKTCFAREVASYLREPSMAGIHGPNFLLLATAISFFWDSEPLECALFRKFEKRYSPR